MAQQINLYDPALLSKRDWLALSNVLLGAGVLAVLVAAAGWLVRLDVPTLQVQAATQDGQLKAMREQVLALGKRVADRHADPRLEQELASARQLADARSEVLGVLRQRLAADAPPFADYLRGFARQTMNGLWLTGFTWDAAADSIEIRGRTVDPALLPEYIRRLNREPAFRGHAFAALSVVEGKTDTPAQKAAFHEFTLVPVKSSAGAGMAPAGKQE
jgi:hypothetical protein